MIAKKIGLVFGCVLVAGTSLLIACSDDAATPAPSGVDAGTTTEAGADTGTAETSTTGSSLKGSLIYTGAKTGPAAYVIVVKDFPPKGPPEGVARVANPTFPTAYSVPKLAPGDWNAVAFLSVGDDHIGPTSPFKTDPQAVVKFTVTAGADTNLDITLKEAAPADGGTDGGDGG